MIFSLRLWKFYLVLTGCAICMALGVPATLAQESGETASLAANLRGTNVTEVHTNAYRFVLTGKTDPATHRMTWAARKHSDVSEFEAFTLHETQRDEWSVYLVNPADDVRWQFDLYRTQVSTIQNGVKTDLERMTAADMKPPPAITAPPRRTATPQTPQTGVVIPSDTPDNPMITTVPVDAGCGNVASHPLPPAGWFTIQQREGSKYLDAHLNRAEDFKVVTRPAQNNDSQIWRVTPNPDGSFTLQQKSNDRYLDAYEGDQHDWKAVTRPPQSNNSQSWTLAASAGGSYTIRQGSSGQYLDAYPGRTGGQAVTRPAQCNDSQNWIFTPVVVTPVVNVPQPETRSPGGRLPMLNERPIHHVSYLGTHNATASEAYGYKILASQRFDVTTQLDAGVRMLEIDIVHDRPLPELPEGMYVCHCGNAPHSSSAMELKRFDLLRPSVPGTTFGKDFIRFGNVLRVIDHWLGRNPGEIVLIMPEINSGTPQLIDREIELANIQSGIYKKVPGENWKTKSELVRLNKRLVILGYDGYDKFAKGSRYLTPKSESQWRGQFTEGPVNIYPEDYSEKATVSGAFESINTDAGTASEYATESFLSKAKAHWDSASGKRYPTFIQFNQIHVGNPALINFINSLNPPEYHVVNRANFSIVSSDSDIDALGYPAEQVFRVPAKYTITVKTKDASDAGTDAGIYLRIAGDKGSTSRIFLNNKISGDAFESGDKDVVTVVDEDVGTVSAVILESDLSGPGAGWFPEYVEISVRGRTKRISIERWIDSDSPYGDFN